MIHQRSTPLERSVKIFTGEVYGCTNLTLSKTHRCLVCMIRTPNLSKHHLLEHINPVPDQSVCTLQSAKSFHYMNIQFLQNAKKKILSLTGWMHIAQFQWFKWVLLMQIKSTFGNNFSALCKTDIYNINYTKTPVKLRFYKQD